MAGAPASSVALCGSGDRRKDLSTAATSLADAADPFVTIDGEEAASSGSDLSLSVPPEGRAATSAASWFSAARARASEDRASVTGSDRHGTAHSPVPSPTRRHHMIASGEKPICSPAAPSSSNAPSRSPRASAAKPTSSRSCSAEAGDSVNNAARNAASPQRSTGDDDARSRAATASPVTCPPGPARACRAAASRPRRPPQRLCRGRTRSRARTPRGRGATDNPRMASCG